MSAEEKRSYHKELLTLTKPQLLKKCRVLNLIKTGSKNEIINRLVKHKFKNNKKSNKKSLQTSIFQQYLPRNNDNYSSNSVQLFTKTVNQTFTHIIDIAVCIKVSQGISSNVIITLSNVLFVVLNCIKCKRTARTVCFNTNGTNRCTGSSGHTGYIGQIIKIESFEMNNNFIISMYSIGVKCNSFRDRKYKQFKCGKNPIICPNHIGTWSSVYFSIKCKICNIKNSNLSMDKGGKPRPLLKCEHICCNEYISSNSQPWMQCRKLNVTPVIIGKLLQSLLVHKMSKQLINVLISFCVGYW